MNRVRVPSEAKILIEVGGRRPTEAAYEPFSPFKILWVITNGAVRRNFLWITVRQTGIYVAFGGPDHMHTSYHSDGEFHWKSDHHTVQLERRPPWPDISEPILVQNAATAVTDDVLERFDLTAFDDRRVDRIVYLDNRMLPTGVFYQVWAVPPFRHADVPLITESPAHIHITTHSNPWIEVIIYEQRPRRDSGGEAKNAIETNGKGRRGSSPRRYE